MKYVERVQKKLKNAIESGMLNPEQQYALIETCMDDLLSVNKINEKAVTQFEEELTKLFKQMEETQKNISELYKKTYDSILEL